MPVVEIVSEMGTALPAPVRIPVAGAKLPPGPLHIHDGGRSAPAQRQGEYVVAILPGFEAGKKRRYNLETAPLGTIRPGITLKEGANQLAIVMPEGPFTTYNFDPAVARPHFHPVHGPGAKRVTRDFPMKDVPEEKEAKDQDHPHHRSFWTAYDEVNGVNNWAETPNHGWTKHKSFTSRWEGPVFGGFTATATWTSAEGKPILDEQRTIHVYNVGPDQRLLDYDVILTSAYEDVHYGDTKEGGLLAFRVYHSMKEAKGGRMENNEGGVGEKVVWGKPAAWLDYSGPIEGAVYGIGMMDHPGNPNHPCRWHARAYGLVGTNPFAGQKAFGNGPAGGYTQKKGTTLTFRYRVLMHKGDAKEGRVDQHYHAWIAPPVGKIVG
jgi:hypothetical protein